MSGNSMGTTPGQGTMGTGGKLGASQNPFANEPGRDANGQLIPGYGTLPPGTMLDFPMDNPQGNIPQQPPMAPPQSGTPGRPVPVAPMTPMGPGLANPGGAGVGQTQTPQMGGGSPGMGGKGGQFNPNDFIWNGPAIYRDPSEMIKDQTNMFNNTIGNQPGVGQLLGAVPQQPLAQRQPNMPARLPAPPRVGPGPMNPPPSAGRGSNAGRGPGPQKVRSVGAGRGGMIRR